jgi:RHS repeat-associated protein
MIPVLRSFCLFTLVLITAAVASAQVVVGTPPFGSFGGGPDVVNLGNLNTSLSLFTIGRSGRGTNFTYQLTYDSSVWYPVTSGSTTTWQPVANYGWRGQTEVETGYVSYTVTQTPTCYFGGVYNGIMYSYSNWTYHDSFGTSHYFPMGTTVIQPTGQYCSSTFTSATATAADDSGWTLSATGSSLNGLTSKSGQIIHPPVNVTTGAATFTDRNGNQITVNSSAQFFDTLSSQTAVLAITGAGTVANPMKFTYTPPSGGSAVYQLNYTNYTVATGFSVSGISEYKSSAAVPLVTSITLPDNSSYSFTYEATPGTCTPDSGTTSCVTARLASVTLPTGGQITYSYSFSGCTTGNHGIFSDGSASCLQRTTPDGTWTYTRSQVSGNHWQTLVSDATTPTANQTLIDFQKESTYTYNYYETQRSVFQGLNGGTLLQTIYTCYNAAAPPCTATAVATPFTQRTVNAILPGSGNLQAQHTEKYDSYGNVTETDDYDWGSGAIGALLKKTAITYATLTNITSFPQQITVTNGGGTVITQTKYNYGDTVTGTSGTPQHTTPPGSRGNVLSVNYYTNGSTYLTASMSYFDTGNVQTVTDVNGAATTFNYSNSTATCGNSFPTSVSEPLSLTRSMTWSCTGGVQLTSVDENSQTVTTTWNEPYFWRPSGVTDPLTNVTSLTYSSSNPRGITQSLTFNGNQSIAYTGTGFDGLGRPIEQSHLQAPGASTWDQVTQSYDSNGRPWKTSAPCVTTGSWTCPVTAQTTAYDALNRPLLTTDGGGGTVSYSYSQNDVLVTVGQIGPPPTGESNKRRQLEYDALGRLTSVCEITGASGSGSCGQNSPQTGFWTKYTYDPLGNLTVVTQNAQGTAQPRNYSYDFLSRLTAETNPESGTTTYVYDFSGSSFCGGYTSNGDLVRKVDAIGTSTCDFYDSLHRLTDVGTTRGSVDSCKRFRYDNTSGVLGIRPTGVSVSNVLGRLTEAETDTCAWPITQSSIITDEWFSYTARGEVSDFYESTPHSGGYYHQAATYWANGVINQLNAAGSYAVGYNLDGEGRVYSTNIGALNSTVYNAASQPTQITFASLDSDTFTYDPNTNRMTQYKYNINSQPVIGNLMWNPNGTLAQLAITDPFNSNNSQTCTYAHDDLSRIASVNCGASKWQQNFGYDVFGNITKTVPTGSTGYSFQATYSTATNRMTSIGGSTPSYDANGNVLNDFLHSYAWNADGRPITIDGVSVTYDALGRMVERNNGGAYSEIAYAPTGEKIEVMNGQSYTKAFAPLPGGAVAVWGGGVAWYRHPDYLGSSRFASTAARTMYYDGAYAPFGEPYAQTGSTDLSFTGMNQDTVSNLYDFPAREYGIQGRWASPDPAGLAATDLTDPRSWNRYAYVRNNPLALVDPTGLDCDGVNLTWFGSDLGNGTGIFTPDDCAANGGTWGGNGFLNGPSGSDPGSSSPGDPTPGCTPIFDSDGRQTGFNCDAGGSSGPGSISAGGGNSSSGKGSTIGPQRNWWNTKAADCTGTGLKEFVGGLVLKGEIDALGDWFMGEPADVSAPRILTGATASYGLGKGFDTVAENKSLIRSIRLALRDNGYRVTSASMARTARGAGRLALVFHVAFAVNDGRNTYNACVAE